MRILATEINDSILGRVLLQYSHVGEEPTERPVNDRIENIGAIEIVAVRHSDDDNTIALCLGGLLTEVARDDDGKVSYGEDGKPLRRLLDPPAGFVEIGFNDNGWIEVDG